MSYNFVADSLHTKKLFSRISSIEVRLQAVHGRFCILEPPLGRLGTMYDVHLGIIGKRVVDFLLVLTEFFSLGVTVEALGDKIDRKSAISLQRGHFLHG